MNSPRPNPARSALPLLAAAACLLLPACHDNAGLMRRAAAGEAAAQFEYGRCLLTGQRGIAQQPELAQAWLMAAARQGHSRAMAALGACHAAGIGYPSANLDAARHWYTRAADKGDRRALLELAQLELRCGQPERALPWLQRAADARLRGVRMLLAAQLLAGEQIPQDIPRAIDNIRIAAMEGSGEAAYLMHLVYTEGDAVPPHAGIARGWLENAAQLGYAPAREQLKAQQNAPAAPLPPPCR